MFRAMRAKMDRVKELGLVVMALHQRSAPLDAREQLLELAGVAPGADRVLLATCHRVELYLALPDDLDPAAWAARELGLPVRDPLWASITIRRGQEAAERLLRIAAGLDSQIAGEPQIVGQIRAALEAADDEVHPLLRRLFERALHVARSLRRGTRLGTVRRSVGSLAVDEVVRSLPDPARGTVMVIGAGEMGRLAVRALAHRVGRIIVANRDREHGEAAAAPAAADVISLDEVPAALEGVDAVIAAADTRGAVLTPATLAGRALVVVDIAVPRSVPEEARHLPGLIYRTVDDLVDEGGEIPQTVLADAAARCADEGHRFTKEWSERAASGTIRELRANADGLRRVQLERALRRLGHLSDRDRGVVDALSVSLTNALLHEGTVQLRRDAARRRPGRP